MRTPRDALGHKWHTSGVGAFFGTFAHSIPKATEERAKAFTANDINYILAAIVYVLSIVNAFRIVFL